MIRNKAISKARSLSSFKKKLAKSADGYLTMTKVPALKVHVQFSGKLDAQEVLWDMELQTLASYHLEHLADRSDAERAREVHSFIDIQPPEKDVARLHVVLAIPIIDAATVKKTIIMIRCYRRLKIGKHIFGKNLK